MPLNRWKQRRRLNPQPPEFTNRYRRIGGFMSAARLKWIGAVAAAAVGFGQARDVVACEYLLDLNQPSAVWPMGPDFVTATAASAKTASANDSVTIDRYVDSWLINTTGVK